MAEAGRSQRRTEPPAGPVDWAARWVAKFLVYQQRWLGVGQRPPRNRWLISCASRRCGAKRRSGSSAKRRRHAGRISAFPLRGRIHRRAALDSSARIGATAQRSRVTWLGVRCCARFATIKPHTCADRCSPNRNRQLLPTRPNCATRCAQPTVTLHSAASFRHGRPLKRAMHGM